MQQLPPPPGYDPGIPKSLETYSLHISIDIMYDWLAYSLSVTLLCIVLIFWQKIYHCIKRHSGLLASWAELAYRFRFTSFFHYVLAMGQYLAYLCASSSTVSLLKCGDQGCQIKSLPIYIYIQAHVLTRQNTRWPISQQSVMSVDSDCTTHW